ncbi:MAG: LysR family transcriptional regulator [Deltaproteobacteria bacterium]|nr:LysR family transcriptional regulator [Deltaproteobacteria bacterium]
MPPPARADAEAELAPGCAAEGIAEHARDQLLATVGVGVTGLVGERTVDQREVPVERAPRAVELEAGVARRQQEPRGARADERLRQGRREPLAADRERELADAHVQRGIDREIRPRIGDRRARIDRVGQHQHAQLRVDRRVELQRRGAHRRGRAIVDAGRAIAQEHPRVGGERGAQIELEVVARAQPEALGAGDREGLIGRGGLRGGWTICGEEREAGGDRQRARDVDHDRLVVERPSVGAAGGREKSTPRTTGVHVRNLYDIDLNLLVSLDAILTTRSVTAAAARVRLSKPAMSHALARIRTLLGDEILVRSGRQWILTERAQALAAPLAELLGATQRLLTEDRPFDPATLVREFRIHTTDHVLSILGIPIGRAVG